MVTPLVKLFKSPKHRYFYDAVKNEIVTISESLFSLLEMVENGDEDWNKLVNANEEIASLLENYYPAGGGTTRDFFASSRHHLLTQKKTEFVTPLNTSYAAPTISSAIVNCLIAHPGKSIDYIIECVKANGIR